MKIGDEDPIPDELLKLIYLSKLVEKRYASLEDVYLAVKNTIKYRITKCLKYSDEFYSFTSIE